MRNLLLASALLLTSACSTTQLAVECASMEQGRSFRYVGADKLKIVNPNTLRLTSDENVIYYNIPAGTACRVQPAENIPYYEQEEH